MISVKYKQLHPNAKKPTRAYDSAGYDLFPLEAGVIKYGLKANIHLGFATEIESGYVAIIDDRGSTGNKEITHLAGVIDADYRDEWILIMKNLGYEDYRYTPDKAIAQVLFFKVEQGTWEDVDSLSVTKRGAGKFGSSGV